jgi:hypothetical protein
MRKTVVGVLGSLLAITAAACTSSSTSSTSTSAGAAPKAQVGALNGKTPAQILSAATAAARKADSAHYVLTAVSGKNSQSIVGDSSTQEAQQTLSQGTQHIQVVYIGGVAYVQGNAAALTTDLGFAATVATSYANKWIAVHKTDSLFKSLVSAVTLTSTLNQLNPSGTLTLTNPTTVAGRQTIGVKGGLPGPPQSGITGTATLYVATSAPTVPLKLTGTATQGTQHVTETGTFSDWGKPVHLTTPTGAVAFSSVPTK